MDDFVSVEGAEGKRLAELLRATREPLLRGFELQELSKEYLRQSREIIDEYACFCESEETAHPWQLRQKYLASRVALRSGHLYSASYLESHGRELGTW